MHETQVNKIAELLDDRKFHCTSEMYALYMSDPRRRLCDLKDKGYILEGKKCTLHDYHKGGSKMWRLISKPYERNVIPEIIQEKPIEMTQSML